MLLPTQVGSLRLRNLTLLASGIVDETGGSIARAARAGAGGVVTKSVGMKAKSGHPGPNFFEVEGGAINAMGLPNPGIDGYAEEMADAKPVADGFDCPIIGSVFGGDANDFATLAGRMEDMGASAIEMNLSCPHAKGYGADIGSDPKLLGPVVEATVAAVNIPVWAKLTPNVADVASCGVAAARAGASGLTVINTVKALAIDPDLRRPILGNIVGGLSGPGIKAVGVRATWDCWNALEAAQIDPRTTCPIIGVGGIENARDALEYVLAGASAVQIGTAFLRHGYNVFTDVTGGVQAWLSEQQSQMLADHVGAAHAPND